MTFGKGMFMGNSTKQKINTTTSTESELVSVHYSISGIIWSLYFLEHQGFKYTPVTIHQNNMSTILLENNGKVSSRNQTRHINIRYFFITDCIKKGQLKIKHCPADEMIADFFTLPLNGAKFCKFHNIIMN